jgi:hypothetical protein
MKRLREVFIGALLGLCLIYAGAAQNTVQNPIFQPQYGAVQEITNCRVDLVSQAANISGTQLCILPSFNALYRIHCYVVVTQAATTSSTMPACLIAWTDSDSGVSQSAVQITSSSGANTLGLNSLNVATSGNTTGTALISGKPGSVVNFQTSGYASSGATPMQYAIHIRTELVY